MRARVKNPEKEREKEKRDYEWALPRKPTNMTETSQDPEVVDSENPDNGRTALNLTCSTTSKSKPLPDRGTWSTKLDFILSVVIYCHYQMYYLYSIISVLFCKYKISMFS